VIGTVLRIAFTNLRRDRVAQALSFLLPIVFFSIFAVIFGGQGGRPTPRVDVAVVDEDGSELSRRLVGALEREPGLRLRSTVDDEESGTTRPLDRDGARHLVQAGAVPVAVVFPRGFGEGGLSFGGPDKPRVTLYTDPSDPVAPQMVNGLLQKVAMTAAPDLMIAGSIDTFEKYAGTLTHEQRTAVDSWLPDLKARLAQPTPAPGATPAPAAAAAMQGLVATEVVDVLREGRKDKSIVAFYAAGIGVMFLLFTASGAAGALLDEQDSGTLERLLSTRLGMGRLLAGKWLYLTILGSLQMAVMFTWGAVVFGLDLLGHLPGFALVTAFTTAASAGFGLVLASACRTRAQLGGLSTIVILVMSAIGGSMFPRFLMPEALQKAGLVTFNGWALDAYLKVFWREEPLVSLWPQLLVLAGMTAAFLTATRLLARRWERS
jgi:ABC-2 type transport system permease protein